jgi:hypothetical protein
VDYLELHAEENTPRKAKLTLSGLSLKGKIILGVYHSPYNQKQQHIRSQHKNCLITQAKNGDQKAIDDLTLEDMDLSVKVRNRVREEDLYSLVETSFIPYGSESDHYSIIGTIVNWTLAQNQFTGEELYQMLINCNSILITICINKGDLLGEPAIGRRFKGIIWMQGHADFQKI